MSESNSKARVLTARRLTTSGVDRRAARRRRAAGGPGRLSRGGLRLWRSVRGRGRIGHGASGRLRRHRRQGETRGDLGARENLRFRGACFVAAEPQRRRRQHPRSAGLAAREILPSNSAASNSAGRAGATAASPQGHQVITGEGSGFFITADGYAVTNNHVVDHAKSVQVTTDDGTIYTAKVVGTDSKTDLALIKVDSKKDFPYVNFADHTPRVGDWVVAVGNPFGLGGTVTAGIVSARGRDIGAGPYDDYVQIDAPINKGNSGGPAFDVDGNVIGVNTAIYSPSGGSVGIGFDIPADTAKLVVAQLKDSGHVTRGWLGVQIQPVTAGIADSLGLKQAAGAMVDEPQDGSPAAKAGIASGDVITAVNGKSIKDSRELARTIGMMAPDSSIRLDIIRQGQPKTVALTLAQMPADQQARAEAPQNASPAGGVPHLGLSVAPASEVSGAGGRGVVVTAVDPDGLAVEQEVFKPAPSFSTSAAKRVGSAGRRAHSAGAEAQAQWQAPGSDAREDGRRHAVRRAAAR